MEPSRSRRRPAAPAAGKTAWPPWSSARGTLYTWTTQEFPPKPPYLGPETPQTFEPWAVGYVDLDGQLRVEGRLYDVDPRDLRFGMEFEVVVRPFRITEDGIEVHTFGFAPSSSAGS